MQAKITFNGRLEISFLSIPPADIRYGLKDRGFQWDPRAKVWHLASPVNLRFVRNEPISQDGFAYALEYCATYLGLSRAEFPALVAANSKQSNSGPDRFDMMVEDSMAAACGL